MRLNCHASRSKFVLYHDEGDKPLASTTISFLPYERVTAHQPNRTIRLVDGPYVHEGIVQVLESGAWRSVCTNSKNWTAADMGVACKQLGFAGGEWHHWFPHLNDTRQILYQDPGRKEIPTVRSW